MAALWAAGGLDETDGHAGGGSLARLGRKMDWTAFGGAGGRQQMGWREQAQMG